MSFLKKQNKLSSGLSQKLKIQIYIFFTNIYKIISPIYVYKIIGDSMLPVLNHGDYVVVNRLAFLLSKPIIGDVIALRDPREGKVIIKRITKNVNNKYFVEGDNKKSSTDSRIFGMIERKDIIGKIIN